VGGILFGFALLLGLLLTVVGLLACLAEPLYYPAIAVDSHDSFDTISSTFSYVVGRPWHYLFYALVTLFYGSITFLVVALVISLTLFLVGQAIDLGVVRDEGSAAVDVMPQSHVAGLPPVDWDALEGTD